MQPRVTYRATLTAQGFKASRPKGEIVQECRAKWAEGTELRVTIEEYHEDKTNPQLAYAHAAIMPEVWAILRNAGYRCTELQAWEYYQSDIARENKEVFQAPLGPKQVRVRLSAMDKEQMGRFIDEAIQFCADNGHVVPEPDER
jgi:hypothetical protein